MQSENFHSEQHSVNSSKSVGSGHVLVKHRRFVFSAFLFITAVFVFSTSLVRVDESLSKYFPQNSFYLENFNKYQKNLVLWDIDTIKIAVVAKNQDIFNEQYFSDLKRLHEALATSSLVNKDRIESLFSESIRWKEISSQGTVSGSVIPKYYQGSSQDFQTIRENLLKTGFIGQLVASDFKSSIISAPLNKISHDDNDLTAQQLVQKVQEYGQRLSHVDLHIVGNVKKLSDLERSLSSFPMSIEDLKQGVGWVPISYLIFIAITYWGLFAFFRNWRLVSSLIFCATIAMFWQAGVIKLLGMELSPYLMMVPFVTFAIAISHGVQVVIGFSNLIDKGRTVQQASASVMKKLYLPGILSLVVLLLGFLTLFVINIGIIHELAITASLGVLSVLFINVLCLPVVLSYLQDNFDQPNWVKTIFALCLSKFSCFTQYGMAIFAFGALVVFGGIGFILSFHLKVGHPGGTLSEFYSSSNYYQSTQYINDHYPGLIHSLVVMVETEPGECTSFETLSLVDQFQWQMENIPGVRSAHSIINEMKSAIVDMNQGNLKWQGLIRDENVIRSSLQSVNPQFLNASCTMSPVFLHLNQGDADTLDRVTQAVERFSYDYSQQNIRFLLAGGDSGFEAALNHEIAKSRYIPLFFILWIVFILCWISFQSLKAVVCIILPLIATWIMVEFFMVVLGMGITLSSLAIIVLGVCLGVDYGIYIFSQLEKNLFKGMTLSEAYRRCLRVSGMSVFITGITLATGGVIWCFSPVKFFADMGMIFCVVFITNMLGALIIIPSMASLMRYRPVESAESIREHEASIFQGKRAHRSVSTEMRGLDHKL